MNCWEYKECGREEGGKNAEELGVCPAWPDNGADCWFMAGTLCGGRPEGTYADKLGSCRTCDFYDKKMSGEF